MTLTTLTTSMVPAHSPNLSVLAASTVPYANVTLGSTINAALSATTTSSAPPCGNRNCNLADWQCVGADCSRLPPAAQTVIPTVTPTQPASEETTEPTETEEDTLSPRSNNTADVVEHLPATATTTNKVLITRVPKILPGHRRPFNNTHCGECKLNEKGQHERQCQTCRMWPESQRRCFKAFTEPCDPGAGKPCDGH